jgi:hypothetical protein
MRKVRARQHASPSAHPFKLASTFVPATCSVTRNRGGWDTYIHKAILDIINPASIAIGSRAHTQESQEKEKKHAFSC